MEVPAGTLFAELLAHEFEHVLEQIEGVDLAALAASSGAARQVEAGVFESERARAAGRAVAGELYGTDVPVIGGIGRGVGRLARRLWRALRHP